MKTSDGKRESKTANDSNNSGSRRGAPWAVGLIIVVKILAIGVTDHCLAKMRIEIKPIDIIVTFDQGRANPTK